MVDNNKYILIIKYILIYISDKKKDDLAKMTDKKKEKEKTWTQKS